AVPPSGVTTFLSVERRRVREANREIDRRRVQLASGGIAARAVAFSTARPGSDLVRLASEDYVDLALLDGRRSLIGDALPCGTVGHVLEHAPCDVAVLVAVSGRVPEVGIDRPVVIP